MQKKRHNGNGKFECWYFLPKNKAKEVVIGTKCKKQEELIDALNNNKIMEVIETTKLSNGDYMSIKPGTIHALKSGSYVLETQQPSDITYTI